MGKVGPPRRKPGRMGPYVEGFRGSLLASGYSPGSVRHMLKDMGGLGRWMVREDVAAGDLSPTVIGEFLRDLRAQGKRRVPGVRSFNPLLDYLRCEGVLAEPDAPPSPVEILMADYGRWLVVDRGLADQTVLRYEKLARRFLLERASVDGSEFVAQLAGAHVISFLLRESTRVSVGAAKGRVVLTATLSEDQLVIEREDGRKVGSAVLAVRVRRHCAEERPARVWPA